MVGLLKQCGAIGLLLMSSMGVYAADEGSSASPGAGGAAGGISTGAAVALGVLGAALIAVAVDDDDARPGTVNPPTSTTTTTTTATSTATSAPTGT
jgi:hypothetical protein